uniref:Box C/D snoRNA protein 1-like n=1 Tax=Sinocyclocheilus grahami TaxID=75366 RepID=A0A672PWY0_SINGR
KEVVLQELNSTDVNISHELVHSAVYSVLFVYRLVCCSLACVQQHKMVSGCCGVRDKTAFVPLAEFNEINLLNDYRVLEDTARLTQQSNRDRVLLRSHRHPKEVRGMWMIRKARAVKVTLRFLPKVFSKHRENRTVFRRAEGRFYWHLKIHFPQSDAVYSERCPDNRQLDQILNDYIHPSESDPVKRQKYVSLRQTSTRFLNATFIPLLYLELDLKTTLQENLMQKTIVEYPEVFVVLQQHSQQYLTRRPDDRRIKNNILPIIILCIINFLGFKIISILTDNNLKIIFMKIKQIHPILILLKFS